MWKAPISLGYVYVSGPIAPLQFNVELDQMVAVNWFTAIVHCTIFIEFEFKPESLILSDQALNFAFIKFTKWLYMQIVTWYFLNFWD